MKYLSVLCAASAVMLCAAVTCESAAAMDASAVILAFGSTYAQPDGTSAVHRGADVRVGAGEPVESPIAGNVTFAGRVPGPSGGSVLAVTIRCAQGKVTLMPLEELRVRTGDSVAPGARLASAAESGDPSSAEPHVHMSLRVEDVYLDPAALLASPTPVTPDPLPDPQPVPVPVPTPQPLPGAAVDPPELPAALIPGTAGQLAPGVAIAPQGAVSPRVAPVAAAPKTQPLSAVDLQPGVRLAPVVEDVAAAAPRTSHAPRGARRPQLDARSLGVTAIGLAVCAWATFVLLTTRAIRVRVLSSTPVSDRLGIMLQHMRTGDTLCGLTSCSGFLPSQSRSRLAQRR